MKRTGEFVLGLLGGIFGIFGAFFALFIGGLGEAFEAGGLICISMAYILPAILLIIAGIMALVRKESAQNSKAVNN